MQENLYFCLIKQLVVLRFYGRAVIVVSGDSEEWTKLSRMGMFTIFLSGGK